MYTCIPVRKNGLRNDLPFILFVQSRKSVFSCIGMINNKRDSHCLDDLLSKIILVSCLSKRVYERSLCDTLGLNQNMMMLTNPIPKLSNQKLYLLLMKTSKRQFQLAFRSNSPYLAEITSQRPVQDCQYMPTFPGKHQLPKADIQIYTYSTGILH